MRTRLTVLSLFSSLYILSLSFLIVLSLSKCQKLRSPKLQKSNPPTNTVSFKTKQFLNIIKQIESNNGRNNAHRIISTGIHSGDAAIGMYGLMPNTLLEISNRLDKLHKHNPLSRFSKREYKDVPLEDQQYIAEFLASNLLVRMHGDVLKASYAWCYGTNLQPNDITDKMLSSSYVRKFYHITSLK